MQKIKVIKTSLAGVLKKKHLEFFEDAVIRVNEIVFESYLFIRLFVLNRYQEEEQLPDLDNNFIRAVHTVVSIRAHGRQNGHAWMDRISTFYAQTYSKLRNNLPKPDGRCLSQILNSSATSMATSYTNNITMHYTSHLQKYIKAFFFDKKKMKRSTKEEKKQHHKDMTKIYNDIVKHREQKDYESKDIYHEWINIHKVYVIPQNIIDVDEELESNPFKFLKCLIYMSIKLGELNTKYDMDYLEWVKIFVRSHFYNKEIIKNMNKEQKKQLRKETNRIKYDIIKKRNEYKSPEKYHEWINKYRDKITPNIEYEQLKIYLKERPDQFINYIDFMKGEMEKNKMNFNPPYQVKLFQPLPMRTSVIPTNIEIDTNSLLEMFHDTKFRIGKSIGEYRRNTWKRYFKLNKKIFRDDANYTFRGVIYTDGVSCSVLKVLYEYEYKHVSHAKNIWKKPVASYMEMLTKKEREEIKEKMKKIVGVDPGKKELLYMASRDLQGNIQKMRYTYNQRRVECKFKEGMDKRIKLEKKYNMKGIQELLTINHKSCNHKMFEMYIIERFMLLNKLREHYRMKIYRKLIWNTYIHKQKSEEKLVKNIKKKFGENIILVLGNWSPTHQMRYHPPTPNKGLIKRIMKQIRTYLFDEYLTTKICNICKSDHKTEYHIKSRKNPNKKKSNKIPVHGLLVCKNVNCSKLLNRNLNGATNIRDESMYYMENRERREVFRRD